MTQVNAVVRNQQFIITCGVSIHVDTFRASILSVLFNTCAVNTLY